jgi:hypothetical protein
MLLARFSAAEARHLKRWKRERERYFRGYYRSNFATDRRVFSR